jgi:hypothetical protein
MHSTRRDERQFPGNQDPPLLTFQHFELTVQHVEGLIRAMMHMRRRLITWIGREIPLRNDKVSHASRLRAPVTVLTAPIRICRRQYLAAWGHEVVRMPGLLTQAGLCPLQRAGQRAGRRCAAPAMLAAGMAAGGCLAGELGAALRRGRHVLTPPRVPVL